jgi:hypothetical protein
MSIWSHWSLVSGQFHAPAAFSQGISPLYKVNARLGEFQKLSGRFGEENNIFPIQESKRVP